MDNLEFTVTDSSGFARTGHITFNVAPTLIAPDQQRYYAGSPLYFSIEATGGRWPYAWYVISYPEHGVLSEVLSEGYSYLQYTLNAGYSGVDSFVADIVDANGTAVTSTIQNLNRATVAGSRSQPDNGLRNAHPVQPERDGRLWAIYLSAGKRASVRDADRLPACPDLYSQPRFFWQG